MKKILCVIISALLITTMLASCKSGSKKDDTGAEKEENSVENTEETAIKYKTSDELADAFMKISADGDTDGMYALYYDDLLGVTYNRIKDKVSKEEFDKLLSDEMKALTSKEIIPFGSEELPDTVSPLYYVDYLYYSTTGGESTGLTEEQVTDCAVLRVSQASGSYSDHMMVCVDGAWYLTV